MKKKTDKRIDDLVFALQRLVADAERVSNKYGVVDEPQNAGVRYSDWTEWRDLRTAIMNAKHAIARER